MSGTIGTSGSDNLNGGSGADTIDGGDGNDKISAGSGNDIIDGGAGSDTANGGSGNDTLVYNLSENLTGAKDVYTGGSGTDTVLLELTQAQWLDTGVRAELQRYVTFLTTVKVSTQGEVSNGSGSDFVFTFANGTTLTVQMMEKLAISVQETSGGPYLPVDYLAALVTGTATGSVVEAGGVNNDSAGAPTATGDLYADDLDGPDDVFQAVAPGAATTNGYGTFAVTASGVWTFTLDNANAAVQALNSTGANTTLTDSFVVLAADGSAKTVTVTINGSNDAAVITGSSTAELTESNAAQSTGGDLNASDVDSSADFVAQTNVAGSNGYGQFSIDATGAWTYTMDSAHDEFVGGQDYTDSITVATADGTMQVLTVTMHGTNDAPTGTAAAALTVGTEDVTYTVSEADLLAGFNDAEGDTLSVSSLSASNGSAVQNSDGSWTITPSANFNGAVTLTYNVTDGNGGNVGGTQSYSLAAVNDNPTGTATAALAGGTEDVAYTVSAADLLAGFSDVDGDLLSVSGLTASNGAVADNGDGTYTITPTANFNGSVSLGYNVVDGNGGSVAASQSYSLNAVNDAPVITSNGGGESAEIAVAENTSAVTTVSSSDVDGPSATYSIVGGADALKFTINAGTGALAFVAAPDFEAPSDDGGDNVYDVQVQVSDGAAVDTQDIAITVTDVVENSAPTIANQSFTLREHLINAGATGVDASPNLAVIAADADGDPLTYSLTSDNSGGAFALSAGGTLTVKDLSLLDYESAPGSDAGGSFYSVGVSVSDGSLSSSALVKVYVSNVSTATTGTNGGNALDGGNSGETLTGGGGQDVVFGDGGNDTLLGDNGGTPNQDTLYAGSGDDTLNGQERSDDLYGGTGADTFVFNTAIGTSPANIDTIRDFEANGIDKILLDDDIFAALGPVGANTTLNAGNFRVSAGGNAADNNDYILYDTATGNLFYDADGNGSGAKVQFATLTLTGVIGTVDNTDFLVGP